MKRMKWWLCLTLVLLMCMGLAAAENGLYTLETVTAGGPQPVGTAILVMELEDTAIFVSGGYVPDGSDHLRLVDGDETLTIYRAERVRAGSALLLETSRPASTEYLDTLIARHSGVTGFDSYLGMTADGRWETGLVTGAAQAQLDERRLYTLTAAADLLPGAVVYNAQGYAVAVLTAKLSEAEGRWAAVDVDAVFDADEADYTPIDLYGVTNRWATQLTADADFGMAMVSWEDTAPSASGSWLLYLEDSVNHFHEWYELPADYDHCSFPVAPGHSYTVYVYWYTGEKPVTWPDEAALELTAPAAGTVDRYGYTQEDVWVTQAEGDFEDEQQIPLQPVTLAALQAGTPVYLQVTSHYTVDEEVQEYLVFALTAPDGQCFTDVAMFLYMPDYAEDVWHADISKLMSEALEWVEGPVGTWTLDYYYDGDLAGSVSFDVGE